MFLSNFVPFSSGFLIPSYVVSTTKHSLTAYVHPISVVLSV